MAASADTFSQSLNKLIKKFETDKAHYLSKDYSEAQAKIDFITPFFKALGWDVENEAGLLHHQREVIVERGETEGRPDYNFRLAGQTKFFVEAKAPSVPLDSAKHILQAKGYAWNTKQVFFVILTDFEEFRFYDASIQPNGWKFLSSIAAEGPQLADVSDTPKTDSVDGRRGGSHEQLASSA